MRLPIRETLVQHKAACTRGRSSRSRQILVHAFSELTSLRLHSAVSPCASNRLCLLKLDYVGQTTHAQPHIWIPHFVPTGLQNAVRVVTAAWVATKPTAA